MPSYKKAPKKLTGRVPRAKMSGKGMPRGNKSGGASMKSKSR